MAGTPAIRLTDPRLTESFPRSTQIPRTQPPTDAGSIPAASTTKSEASRASRASRAGPISATQVRSRVDEIGCFVRRETGIEEWMKEPYVEGVATHDGPKSCVVVRKGGGEALTGVRAGEVLSREIIGFGVPTL